MSPASYRAAPPRVGRTTLPAGEEGGRGCPAPSPGPHPPGVAAGARRLRGLVGLDGGLQVARAPGPGPRSRRRAAPSARASSAALMSVTAAVHAPGCDVPPAAGGAAGSSARSAPWASRPVVGRRRVGRRRCRLARPGTEDLVERLLERVGVADPVAVVDQHLLQQREGVLAGALARRAARRRAGRRRRSAESAGCRTPDREFSPRNSVQVGATSSFVLNDCCTCRGPRNGVLPGSRSTWIWP